MDSPKGIASRLHRTLRGPMWHGPSIFEAIGDLDAAQAHVRPIASAHSVWELVLHIAVWAEVPLRRLHGDAAKDLAPDADFPPVPAVPSMPAWTAATQRMEAAYKALADEVKALTPAKLDELVVEHEYSVATMLHGVVEHGVYHAGQIMMLRRILEGTTA